MLYKKIQNCRICGNNNLESIIDLGTMHMTGIFPKPGEEIDSSPIEMIKCVDDGSDSTCGLVQLRHTYSLEKMYGDNYGYRSGLNDSMVKHLQALVQDITQKTNLKNGDLIIDIASNDGTLLGAYPKDLNLQLLGIDPTAEKFKKHYPDNVEYIANFFSSEAVQRKTNQKAKVVTSIAMFYDLEDPLGFVKQIRDTLSNDGIWIFEQSYMPDMIRKTLYDTICHEHLEYYGLKQIKWLMDKSGLKIIDVQFNETNGASFRVTVAKKESGHQESTELVNSILKDEEDAGFNKIDVYNQFTEKVKTHKKELLEKIAELKKEGKTIFGYGASTKGNVILQYCGLTPNDISHIAEINEFKFGRVTPGTNIPIISEAEAKTLNPDYMLVLPWHFKNNIVKRESEYLKSGGHLIFPLPTIEIV